MGQAMRIRELNAEEQDQVMAAMAAFCNMVEELGIDPEAEELDTPDLADMLAANWRGQPKAERFSTETMATILGAAVGDYLKHHFKLEWRVVTDEFGTSVALYNGDTKDADGNADFVIAIFDSIEKRIENADGDFVSEFLDGLWEHIQHLERSH